MIKYLLKYWKIAIFAPLLMAVEVVIDLYQPMLMSKIIDVGIREENLSYIREYGMYMILLSLLGMTSAVISGLFAVKSSQSAGADIREDLFKKVQTLSYKNMDTVKPNSLITRLTNDVVQIQQFFQQLMRIMVRAPLMLTGSIVLTFYISIKFGLILVAFMMLLLIVIFNVIKRAKPLFKKVQNSVDAVNGVMLENIKGIRVIKAFVRKDFENERFKKENDDMMHIQMKANRVFSVVMPIIMLTINLVIVAILWVGGKDVVNGDLTTGQIVAVINYITRLLFALMMTGMIFFRISKSSASADRINEIFDMTSEIEYGPLDQEIKGRVEFKNVSFKYSDASDDCVLNDISFKVNPGETLGIIGSTGAGKSTLLQLVPRFYEANTGEVLIDDQPLKAYSKASLNNQIAFIQQQAFLFSGTLQSNVFFNNKASKDVLIHAQGGDIMSQKDGFETLIKQAGNNLSGGQKQRLSIARGLAIQPKILLLDDSTSALDVKTEIEFRNALNAHYKETTILMVAQKITSIMYADQILVIDDGRIVAKGTHEALLKDNLIYRDIYESQLGKVIS